jgi:hypothetical protein
MEPLEASFALYEAIRSNKTVAVNYSYKDETLDVSSDGLQMSPTLIPFNTNRTFGSVLFIFDSVVATIVEALKLNSTLQQLSLTYTSQNRSNGSSDAAAIAEALKVNSVLQDVGLAHNIIGDSGAAAIAKALKVNSVLQYLRLSYNKIGDSGAAAIADALTQHSTLQQLDLSENAIGDAGVVAIEQSHERSFLGLEYNLNARFPEVRNGQLTRKHRFLYSLSDSGFRSFILNDVPPALWPHALAKVTMFPSLIFHLLLQIPGSSNFLV